MLADRLSLSEPEDKESEKLIKERDDQQRKKDVLIEKEKIIQEYRKPKKMGRPSIRLSRRARAERRKQREEAIVID